MGAIPCGCNPVGAILCGCNPVGCNTDGCNPVWVQSRGCNSVGAIPFGGNPDGITRLISKVSENEIPLASQLRPITLLNSDYKVLTGVLSKRILKVLRSVIKSQQSSCVPGANICSSAFNLLSITQAVEQGNKKAAILSLDFNKAYDRVNLEYLEKVMLAMKFDPVFISWILLCHAGAKTRLLLDPISDPIAVDSSVRQGDPVAMVCFILYMEPVLLQIEDVISGFRLSAPVVGGSPELPVVAVSEKEESFVDDVECVVTCDQDFIEIDKVIGMFEVISGALLNRDTKSKVMGLGIWRQRNIWPLPWLSTVQQMKIFGYVFHSDYKTMLNLNWDLQLSKVNKTLFSWSNRSLSSVFERAEVIRTFVLSRIWYRAHVLTPPAFLGFKI